jgi:phytoene dehydrogenase-like protein
MADKSIIIIGAGLAGLATGCFGQMNGYKTQIFERQTKPGGVCVSWERKGYTFDYAIHNLFGITSGTLNNRLWRELGALRGLKTYSFKEFVQVEDTDGKGFTVYTNLDELQKHMEQIFPNDKKKISEFVKVCRRLSRYDLFGAMSGGLGTRIKMLPVLGSLMKYGKITVEDYAKDFSDPFLRKAFTTIQYDIPEVPVIIPLIFLASMSKGDGGWLMGGSSALSKNIERRYLELGGQIAYRSQVVKIIVENDVATGVQLEDGSQHFADLVVSAADGYSTIFNMLEGKYVNDFIRAYYDSYPKTLPFGFEIWYGVNRNLSGEPHALVLFQDEPLIIEGREYNRLDVEIFNFDPTLAPAAKTVVKVVVDSSYDYWQKLSEDLEAYNEEKKRLADLVADRLEKRFPEFKNQIEVADVVTPVSVEHWTAAHRGYCVPYPAPKEIAGEVLKNGVSKTLPGLQGFHMVGQWAAGTNGLATVCLMARDLVRQLCKKDGKEFVTTNAD